ncbi:MAG: N-acetylglucosamine-6-phosphate deacetylase [Firmicutes bacterium]|nr:N-acetylglucosamine-6-phosphate deacetylase [Bacillota bacterium]
MIIYNALIGRKLRSVKTRNGKIEEVADNIIAGDIDACGKRLIPGLIDVHTHGCIGMDTMDADFEPMCRFYAEHGITSFLPTTMTMGYDALERVTNAKTDFAGANILGFHFEGPYISAKHKGAQNEKFIKKPSVEDFKRFRNVRMITVAPELPGSMEFIKEVASECVVSIGHTDCDYETAISAIDNGAKSLTHIYNAMPPLQHRNPGPIGAAFEKQIYVQLICDGFHISKPVVLATYKMFGADRTVLISDSIRSAGLPDGEYESGGLKVLLRDGAARLSDGTIAGSSATLLDCVKTAVRFGIPFDDSVKMASETPANMLGIKKGRIEKGYDADLVILNEDFTVYKTIIAGKVFS